jgi:DNA-directed RNA polymerase specialized sigma24 family protein
MRSRRERTRAIVPLLNSVDRLGRAVEASVLVIAQEIAPRAVSHGERLLGDPSLALTLLEEAAAAVSKTLAEKHTSGKPAIRDMQRYLFRVYLRRINIERRHSFSADDAIEMEWGEHVLRSPEGDIERRILLKEVLESCDTLTREIFYLRLEGCSWKEIEKRCGIPLNAASLRFSKAIRRLRNQLRSATFGLRRSSHLVGGKYETEEEGAKAPSGKISTLVRKGKYYERLSQSKTNRLP